MTDAELNKLIESFGFNRQFFYCSAYATVAGVEEVHHKLVNEKLREKFKDARVVYADFLRTPDCDAVAWAAGESQRTWPNTTHSAILFNIKPIKKKCEKHEPKTHVHTVYHMFKENPEYTFDDPVYPYRCKHCGIPLKAEWRAVSPESKDEKD